jgi:hypothetical protein
MFNQFFSDFLWADDSHSDWFDGDLTCIWPTLRQTVCYRCAGELFERP